MSQKYVRAAACTAVVALAGCGSASRPASPSVHTTSTTATATTSAAQVPTLARTSTAQAATPPAATHPRPRRPHPLPGTLPQTHQLPSSRTRQFAAEIAALWRGIRTGSLAAALPAFFPEAAYVQVKAVADPHSDYVNRLVADYALDIEAAHALLGTRPARARLRAVDVPAAYAHWVPPGSCYNRVGYYEVPNARLVYDAGGGRRSFGIASMISWRGVWYVVHLGAVTRSGSGGIVDDPSAGAGTPTPSSTC
jgi:hypothetical protein